MLHGDLSVASLAFRARSFIDQPPHKWSEISEFFRSLLDCGSPRRGTMGSGESDFAAPIQEAPTPLCLKWSQFFGQVCSVSKVYQV